MRWPYRKHIVLSFRAGPESVSLACASETIYASQMSAPGGKSLDIPKLVDTPLLGDISSFPEFDWLCPKHFHLCRYWHSGQVTRAIFYHPVTVGG